MMNFLFHNYMMDSEHSLYLAIFLFGNMLIILLFKLYSKKNTEALLYYICDFIIRVTFSVPLSFVVFYFVLCRFFGKYCITPTSQAVEFIVLFAIFDFLMRWQIKNQLGVNYFKIHDKV